MSFEEFHASHSQYSYLVAKIYYNVEQEKRSANSSLLTNLVVQFTAAPEGICESCTA